MMKFVLLSLLALASTALATSMSELKALKVAQRSAQRAAGFFDEGRWKRTKGKCTNGKVGEYACKNVDMLDFISHEDMGSVTREGNDAWGWTSADGREFGLIGQTDGTAFVEVKPTGDLKYIGRLPFMTDYSIWRGIKVIGDYAYVGSEAANSGLQIFDLKKLLDVKGTPKTFSIYDDLVKWYSEFGSSHNIVANAATNMIYVVGTYYVELPDCKGGLYMLNVSDPANPTSPGCAGEDGYVHDAQCVVYTGPDSQYTGHEICFGYNEDTLTIYDVSDKSHPTIISKTTYEGASYTHQGWLTSSNMRYLLLDDEIDELRHSGPAANNRSTTYIFDVSTLAKPVNTGYFQSSMKTIDHNQHVINGLSYQANYNAGLRIIDVSSVEADPTGKGFKEVGYFDVHPEDDAVGGTLEFMGSWSVWPFFKSGNLLINSIERGVFSVKFTGGRK